MAFLYFYILFSSPCFIFLYNLYFPHYVYLLKVLHPSYSPNILSCQRSEMTMSFRSLSIFFSTTFSLHFIPFLFVGNFVDSGRIGISMAFLSIYILFSAPAFIFHSNYVHPLFSTPKYTSFIFRPKIYILYFPPRYIHPSFSIPKYTSFIFRPKIYILYFPPRYIHPSFSTPIYTSFCYPPQNIHPLFSCPIYTSFIFHPKICIIYSPPQYKHPLFSAPNYTSFIFHREIYILHFPPQNKDRLFCIPIYTSFSFHPKIYILYFPPQYIHPLFSTPIYTPIIFHPNIYTCYFAPQYMHPLFCTPIYTPFISRLIYTFQRVLTLFFLELLHFQKRGMSTLVRFIYNFFGSPLYLPMGLLLFFLSDFVHVREN
jgi:hypothetical protein